MAQVFSRDEVGRSSIIVVRKVGQRRGKCGVDRQVLLLHGRKDQDSSSCHTEGEFLKNLLT